MPTLNQKVVRVTIEAPDPETLQEHLDSIIDAFENFEDNPDVALIKGQDNDDDFETVFAYNIEFDVQPKIQITPYNNS